MSPRIRGRPFGGSCRGAETLGLSFGCSAGGVETRLQLGGVVQGAAALSSQRLSFLGQG